MTQRQSKRETTFTLCKTKGIVQWLLYLISENNSRYVGQKDAQPFIDEQVVLYEAMERLRGFTYAAVIDVDEIIYARQSKKHNLKNFLVSICKHILWRSCFRVKVCVSISRISNKLFISCTFNVRFYFKVSPIIRFINTRW